MSVRRWWRFNGLLAAQSSGRKVATVAAGSVGAQVVSALALPLLSRLYPPEQFGIYTYLVAVAAIVSAFATLKFEAGVPIADSATQVRGLVRLALLSSFSVCAVALMGLVAASGYVSSVVIDGAADYILVVPALVWVASIVSIVNQLALRSRDYGNYARRTFLTSATSSLVQLLWPLGRSAGGLFAGPVVGGLAGAVFLSSRYRTAVFCRVRAIDMARALRRFWRFPVAFAPSALLNVLGAMAPTLVVARLYDADTVGLFGMGMLIAGVPAALVGAGLSQVAMGEFAERIRSSGGVERGEFLRVTRRLALPAAAVWVGLTLLVPPLVPLVLGEQWAESGAFIRAIAPSAAMGLIVSPLSQILLIYQKALWNACLDVARVALMAITGVIAALLLLPAPSTVLVLSLVYVCIYLVTWVAAYFVVSRQHEA